MAAASAGPGLSVAAVIARQGRLESLPVASDPCSRCGERFRGKLATLYTSWYPDRDHRTAYMSKLDPACASELLVPLLTRPVEDLGNCAQCGSDPGEDFAKTFVTVYVPGKEQYDDQFETCDACAPMLRERLTLGGKLQPDRAVEVRGPSPSQQAWAAIPI